MAPPFSIRHSQIGHQQKENTGKIEQGKTNLTGFLPAAYMYCSNPFWLILFFPDWTIFLSFRFSAIETSGESEGEGVKTGNVTEICCRQDWNHLGALQMQKMYG